MVLSLTYVSFGFLLKSDGIEAADKAIEQVFGVKPDYTVLYHAKLNYGSSNLFSEGRWKYTGHSHFSRSFE
jgi:hypothetical protein